MQFGCFEVFCEEQQMVLDLNFHLGDQISGYPQYWPFSSECLRGSLSLNSENEPRLDLYALGEETQTKGSAENVKVLEEKLSFKRDNCVDVLVTAHFRSLTKCSHA